MRICPVCLNIAPSSRDACPFCGAEAEPDEASEIDEKIEWVIVRTVTTEIEARLIAGRLRAEGVPAFVLSQVDTTRNFTVGGLAVAKVFVPKTLREEAEQILSAPPDEIAGEWAPDDDPKPDPPVAEPDTRDRRR